MSVPRTFDEEFKRNAVDMWAHSGKSLKSVARELGISDVTLRTWRDRILGKTSIDYVRLHRKSEAGRYEALFAAKRAGAPAGP